MLSTLMNNGFQIKRLPPRGVLSGLLGLLLSANLFAQPDSTLVERAQQELAVFTDIIAVSLDLDEPAGLFGINAGSIEARYLHGQGAFLEVRSPLAARRQRLQLVAFGSTMRGLHAGRNPFENVARQSSPYPEATVENRPSVDVAILEKLSKRLQGIDYQLIVDTALRQASQSAEALRSLDGLDEESYTKLRSDLAELQQELQEIIGELAVENTERMESLRQKAVQEAEDLHEKLEQAQAEYEKRWLSDREEFEESLYLAACESAAGLTQLSDDDSIAIALIGLGDEGARARPDRIHILPVGALKRCAEGQIDVSVVQAESAVYSY